MPKRAVAPITMAGVRLPNMAGLGVRLFGMAVLGMAGLGIALAGCGGGSASSTENSGVDSGVDAEMHAEVVRVFAAASLTDAFDQLARAFENKNPRYEIELNLAGSSSLRAQIVSGAPADVFASANVDLMDEVNALGSTVGASQTFATNELVIAVPAGNPAALAGIEDFDRSELFLGLCAETVPCGILAASSLAAAGVEPSVDTREPDVRALLTKIAVGELDGGMVYATDVRSALDKVDRIDIPGGSVTEADYPIAVLDQGDSVAGATAFVDFVLGSVGREVLRDNGFGAP